MRRSVVFPAPFVPRMTVMLPAETLRLMPCRTSLAPKCLRTPCAVMRSVEMADIASLRRALAQAGQDDVDEKRDEEQDDAQRDSAVEAALTGLKHKGRGEGSRRALDVAAYQHGCPDLTDGIAKRRNDGTQDSQTCLAKQSNGGLCTCRAERERESKDALVGAAQSKDGEAHDNRESQRNLSNHHRRRGVKQLQHPERAAAGEQEVYQKARHDRWKTHQRVDDVHDALLAPEVRERKHDTKREPCQR